MLKKVAKIARKLVQRDIHYNDCPLLIASQNVSGFLKWILQMIGKNCNLL